jgi:hypothetical protein
MPVAIRTVILPGWEPLGVADPTRQNLELPAGATLLGAQADNIGEIGVSYAADIAAPMTPIIFRVNRDDDILPEQDPFEYLNTLYCRDSNRYLHVFYRWYRWDGQNWV